MNNQDILLQVTSRLDNNSLELFSHTSLWSLIREFADKQSFWYLRVQHLVGRELKWRIEDSSSSYQACWKRAYYLLLNEDGTYLVIDESLKDKLSLEILLELGNDPSIEDNHLIKIASGTGCTEAVRLLLKDPRVDPSAGDNFCIKYSSLNGYPEVVKLLLADSRADPSVENSLSIRKASLSGRTEVIRLLLADGRADPSADNNYAIRWAFINNHTEVYKLLLEDGRTILPR